MDPDALKNRKTTPDQIKKSRRSWLRHRWITALGKKNRPRKHAAYQNGEEVVRWATSFVLGGHEAEKVLVNKEEVKKLLLSEGDNCKPGDGDQQEEQDTFRAQQVFEEGKLPFC